MNPQQNQTTSYFTKWIKWFAILTIIGIVSAGSGLFFLYRHISPQLPDIDVLRDVNYQIPLKVYSRDKKLIAQFGEKKRIPIKIADVPEKLIQAFLGAEDDRFFEHPGVDYQGLLRALIEFIRTGEKRQGGSTITMQVARNFFLTPEKTFMRKIKEIFLAIKIEHGLEKAQILELYLNKIYLGHRSYGIGAAAQLYYGKKLDELDIAQMAMIAGLPKAPSRFNPITNPQRALTRRNYVLKRMHKVGFISSQKYQNTLNEPTTAKLHAPLIEAQAPFLAEMVRKEIVRQFGEEAYTQGFRVYTTIDSRLQSYARTALRETLHEYDERHGFRGPQTHIDQQSDQWFKQLENFQRIGDTIPAIVTEVSEKSIQVSLANLETMEILWEGLKWARKYRSINSRGTAPKSASEIVSIGDIIRIRATSNQQLRLAQVPKTEGAFVSINPYDGSIAALTGGFDFFNGKYNRATHAKRQPGSGFKPILYTKALEEGFTTASIINDAPVVFDESTLETEWRPQNYSGKFYGPTRLRVALRKSRNLVSIRLMREIGINKIIDSGIRFGLPKKQLPKSLSLALGSGSASPLQMARVFAVFANGGFLVTPYFIKRIDTSKGETIFRAKPIFACSYCKPNNVPPEQLASRVISPQINYIINSLLQDVVRNGTARRALKLNRSDLAGKTGTTNEQRDAWFNGFNLSLVAVAWVGFDSSKPLGNGETGGKAALPMWMNYMEKALKDVPEMLLEQPEGIITVRIDPETGLLAHPTQDGILEIFHENNAPTTLTPLKYPDNPEFDDSGETEIETLF